MERNECAEILTKLANTKINSIMENIKESNQYTLKMLKGHEINSLNYEGIVYINGRNNSFSVHRDGEIIDYLNTNNKIENLWKEYRLNEVELNELTQNYLNQ
tara:strand:- start:3 stop:308 length:306 start_codon:yes stop_codon:yes gene_type:complete